MVYGYADLIDERGDSLGPFGGEPSFDLWSLIWVHDYIAQPAVFLRADRVAEIGGLDESLHWGLDWDLWIRMACRWPVVCVPRTLARMREHRDAKTAHGGFRRLRELRDILARHGAAGWPPAAVAYGLDTFRRRWPAVFGPGSRAQAAALRGRVWPRLMAPLHRSMARVIDGRIAHGQGIDPQGWLVSRRARAAVRWRGQAGVVVVRGEVAEPVSGRRLEARVAGGRVVHRPERSGPFELELLVAFRGGVPRALPGTSYELDPVMAAFNIGAVIRWLDFNDTWLAAEWGHPSDNLGGILAVADYLSRQNRPAGKDPLMMRDVLTAMIKAHEIQGVLALENSYNRVGLDHVLLVRVASTAVVTRLLGGGRDRVLNALSHAWIDGGALRTYRHAPKYGIPQELGCRRRDEPRRAPRTDRDDRRDGLPVGSVREGPGATTTCCSKAMHSTFSGPTAAMSWRTSCSRYRSRRSSMHRPLSRRA